MSEGVIRCCQHKALERFIAKHGDEWRGLLLGLWKTGGWIEGLSTQELLNNEALGDDYWLYSLRRDFGAKWLRHADKDDPIGYLAWWREDMKRYREQKARPRRAWKKALERWKQEEVKR